jgi:hypothetical protein
LPSEGFGYATAVNDAGHIAYFTYCDCIGNEGNAAVVINDSGTYALVLSENTSESSIDPMPLSINGIGSTAGYYVASYGPSVHEGNIAWSSSAATLYYGGAHKGGYAYAINDDNVSVGQDIGPTGTFAVAYSGTYAKLNRALLLPPKNTDWIGTATGINDAGEIVGYAKERAVRFFIGGYAQVLPVAAAGISTSAQAIDRRGDIVGNAGSQAFLYRGGRTTYLPRPAGETAGNAVAYALNATDEIVGDIVTSTGQTAFLYANGQAYDLNSLLPAHSGWQITHAASINDQGQIVGEGYYSGEGSSPVGFSMKPQPPNAPKFLIRRSSR